MKLKSLELKNFRQFYGDQEIIFASGQDGRNVTLVHGYNGAGKTALLNAFIWCLYGETSPDLEEPERLENERAMAELAVGDSAEVSVRLQYEVHDSTYTVQRTRKVFKSGDSSLRRQDPELLLGRRLPDGKWETEGRSSADRQLRIHQLLPKGLYPFFFFNGERVERLARPDAYDDVEKGVKTLLDVELFERGMNHLRGGVTQELGRELKSFGDDELKAALEDLEKVELQLEMLNSKLALSKDNTRALSDEIELYERRQEAIKSLTDLTEKRNQLRTQETDLIKQESSVNASLARVFSVDGFLAFAEPVFRLTDDLVAGARHRGEIPAKIKPQFVNDLLERACCICDRSINRDSPEHEALVRWREKTGLADLEENIAQTSAMLMSMRQRRQHYFAEIDRLQGDRSDIISRRRSFKEQIDVLEQELGNHSHGEDAASLANILAERRRDLEKAKFERLFTEREIQATEERRDALKAGIKRLEARDSRSALIKRQRDAVDRVADALEAIFKVQKDNVRAILDRQISEIWNDAAIKDYKASVTDDYRLVLTKRVGTVEQPVYGASTGERQVLALSFVASLVRAAAENAHEEPRTRVLGVPLGGHYPLVMDSPFGSLEDDYRAKVSEWIPKLAQQVIVLVSKSQWRHEVESAVRERVGREYVLELHTGKQQADRGIDIKGKTHAYVVSTHEPFEYTRLQEVE